MRARAQMLRYGRIRLTRTAKVPPGPARTVTRSSPVDGPTSQQLIELVETQVPLRLGPRKKCFLHGNLNVRMETSSVAPSHRIFARFKIETNGSPIIGRHFKCVRSIKSRDHAAGWWKAGIGRPDQIERSPDVRLNTRDREPATEKIRVDQGIEHDRGGKIVFPVEIQLTQR